ncbi:MAG: sulfatase [Acidobacteria bacterium]|nr:sulfatase [Acidobacteriota bacterium]
MPDSQGGRAADDRLSSPQDSDGYRTTSSRGSAFWPALWLAVALVLMKASYLLNAPRMSLRPFGAYLSALAAISYQDVVLALTVGLLHWIVLRTAGSRQQVARVVHGTFVGCYVFAATYGIVNLVIFRFFQKPLSYPLLYLAGDARNVRSSVMAFVTPPLALAIAGTACLYLVFASTSARLARAHARPARGIQVSLLVLGMIWTVAGRSTLRGERWRDREDKRVAENAHWTFLASCLNEIAGTPAVVLSQSFPPEDLRDFSSVGDRARDRRTSVRRAAYRTEPFRPKNVILLVLESVPAGALSLYGNRYNPTPNLLRESAQALVFDAFYTHVARTSNAMAAILLSVYPGLSWRDLTEDQPALPGTTLAEMVARRGFRTALITSTDLTWARQDVFLANRGYQTIWHYTDLQCTPPFSSWGVEDRCTVDGVERWLEANRGQPFFITAWTDQTHHPYEPTPGLPLIDFFGGKLPPDDYDLGRYLNVLHETDRHLGRLFDYLRKRNLADDTLVVIVGDHGQAFGDPHPQSYGHGTTLFQENVQVPLMIWNPRLFPAPKRSRTPGGHVDLNQTIADLIGVEPAPSWHGFSLFASDRPARAYFYVAADEFLLGVREENWKYILDVARGREQLFDLASDPTEQRNVAAAHPNLCHRLRQRLAAWVAADRQFSRSIHNGR